MMDATGAGWLMCDVRIEMTLDQAFQELRRRNQPSPKPHRLPTEDEVRKAEQDIGFRFHPDFRRFQLEASDVNAGVLEPGLVLPDLPPYCDLRVIARHGWKLGVPPNALSFCPDNGNYYFLDESGTVRYWDHDSRSESGRRASFADWIMEDWLFDYDGIEPSPPADASRG
jgi:hypothetical protein